jgi:hypothetical protein
MPAKTSIIRVRDEAGLVRRAARGYNARNEFGQDSMKEWA